MLSDRSRVLDTILLGCFLYNSVLTKTRVDLHNDLFLSSRYSKDVRPRKNNSESVQLSVSMAIGFLIKYMEKDGFIILSITSDLEWTDDFLTWSPQNYDNTTSIIVTGDMLWTPKMEVLSRHSSTSFEDGFKDQYIRIYHDGKVSLRYSGILNIVCPMNPQYFPFDEQTCNILIRVREYTQKEVSIKMSAENITQDVVFDHSIWKLGTTPHFSSAFIWVTVNLSRKSLYYVFTMILPSSILSVLILFAFFIRIEEGEKISFGITIFLALVVFLAKVGDMIPENSNAVAVIGLYYILLMCSSAVAIANSIVWSFMIKKNWGVCTRPRICHKVHPVDQSPAKFERRKCTQGRLFDIFTFALSLGLIVIANVLIIVQM